MGVMYGRTRQSKRQSMRRRECWRVEALLVIVLTPTIAFGLLVCLYGWPNFSAISWGSVADWIGAIGSGSAAVGAVWIAVSNEKSRKHDLKLDGAIEIVGGRAVLSEVSNSLEGVTEQIAYFGSEVNRLQSLLDSANSALGIVTSEIDNIEGPIPDDLAEWYASEKANFDNALQKRDQGFNEYIRTAEFIEALQVKVSTIQYTTAARYSTRYSHALLGVREQLAIVATAVRHQVLKVDSDLFSGCKEHLETCMSCWEDANSFVLK